MAWGRSNVTFRPAVRSVHFASSVEMPLRTSGKPSLLGPSRSRHAVPYAPSSTAPSARSWVYPQHEPTPLPPSPTDHSEPLPGPFHKQKGLHVVNAVLGSDDDDTENTQANSLGIDFGHNQHQQTSGEVPSLSKNKGKKSIIGRVFRGVFTKESSSSSSSPTTLRKLQRKTTDSYDTVPTLATYGDSNSTSNSVTYGTEARPGASSSLGLGLGLRVPHNAPTPILEVPETEDQSGSPLPEVLRLSDNIPPLSSRARPAPTTTTTTNSRPKSVSRKPVSAILSSSRVVEPTMSTEPAAGQLNTAHTNLEDRTTVMIYDQNTSRAPTGAHTPPALSRHPSSTRASVQPDPTGAGLPPLQPLRSSSFAAPQPQPRAAPSSIRDPMSAAPTRRTSVASALAPRSRQLSLNRGVIGIAPSASSIPDFPPGPYPPPPVSRATSILHPPPPPPLPIPLQAPIDDLTSPSAHPLRTEDYLKMTLSPPSSKHTVTTSNTTATFSSNATFSSQLSSPFVRFVKTLYKMPWISHDRVTVDYLPDHGLLGAPQRRGKVKKRMATWYRTMVSRGNSDMDLLERRRRRRGDLDASLGAALAELGSPFAAKKRRSGRTEGRKYRPSSRRHRDRDRNPSSHHHPHRHHHHQHELSYDDSSVLQTNNTPLPSAPPFYPYFSPFPMAFPPNEQNLPTMTTQQPGTQPTPYQAMFSPAPFYVFAPPAPNSNPAMPVPQPSSAERDVPTSGTTPAGMGGVPVMLVPGGVDGGHVPGGFS